MKFNFLKSDGDQIGLTIPLPNGDGTDTSGFGWNYVLSTDSYYDFSFFQSGKTGEVVIDNNFLCGNTLAEGDTTHQTGYCYNVLPKQKFSD